MFAVRLVNLIETHADRLSEGLLHRLKSSDQCSLLLQKVPADELVRRTHEIYRNLNDWLLTKTESEIEERYVGLGIRRARQGVPFSAFLWAISATKEYLWEFLQREGLLEEPLELFGELDLLHSLEHFFDRILYFASIGYESVRQSEAEHVPRIHTVAHR
ncbi:MAG: hypothetical protein LAO03_07375 [Acidobacteriia bacterium]|nr:hypothetical protein [Terriglobia bacterium]